MNKIGIILLIMSLFVSCESAADLDTKKIRKNPNPADKVDLTLTEFHVETNGVPGNFKISEVFMQIDTTKSTPIVWGLIKIQSIEIVNFNKNRLQLDSMYIGTDNLATLGNPVLLSTVSANNSLVKFDLIRGFNSMFDTLVSSDPLRNKTEISFSWDQYNKRLWIYMNARVYENRVIIENQDPNLKSYIPDSLLITSRFNLQY